MALLGIFSITLVDYMITFYTQCKNQGELLKTEKEYYDMELSSSRGNSNIQEKPRSDFENIVQSHSSNKNNEDLERFISSLSHNNS